MIKTETVMIKLLPAQKMALKQLAEREGEAMSVTLRRIIRAEIERAGLSPTDTKSQRDPQRA